MIKCVAIVGPTASGKTALSIELARRFGGEVVNCDSMQIYKYMNIGTAKPTEAEISGIRHHMLDFLSPEVNFSAEAYREGAMAAISDISIRGRLPFIVGGTGLYLDTLLRAPTPDVPKSSPEYRDRILRDIKSDEDRHALWQRLAECDPESAEKIHENNVKRVIRALEVYDATGKPKSYWDGLTRQGAGELDVRIIVLSFNNRQTLYDRIDRRVDIMFDMGLAGEVERLYADGYLRPDTTASSAIGYKELVAYIEGDCTLEGAREQIKLASRRYAKRQLTWFAHEENPALIYLDDGSGAMRSSDEVIREAVGTVEKFLSE